MYRTVRQISLCTLRVSKFEHLRSLNARLGFAVVRLAREGGTSRPQAVRHTTVTSYTVRKIREIQEPQFRNFTELVPSSKVPLYHGTFNEVPLIYGPGVP
jgi:hypothetical protein